MFTGEFTIEAKGKKRHLKFGTLCFAMFCEAEGIEFSGMIDRMVKPKPFSFIHLFHSAAVAHCRINKVEPDFSIEDVSEWIDECGPELMEHFNKIMVAPRPQKKTKAKEKGGKTGTS